MSSTYSKQVLVMGLKSGPDPNPSKGVWSAEQVLEAVNSNIAEAKKAGFYVENFQADLEKPYEIIIEEVRAVLRKHQWDGVSIGFGLRGREDLTPLFEQLVNAVVEEVQPPPKFAFSLRPNLVWEAIRRVFGVDQEQA